MKTLIHVIAALSVISHSSNSSASDRTSPVSLPRVDYTASCVLGFSSDRPEDDILISEKNTFLVIDLTDPDHKSEKIIDFDNYVLEISLLYGSEVNALFPSLRLGEKTKDTSSARGIPPESLLSGYAAIPLGEKTDIKSYLESLNPDKFPIILSSDTDINYVINGTTYSRVFATCDFYGTPRI